MTKKQAIKKTSKKKRTPKKKTSNLSVPVPSDNPVEIRPVENGFTVEKWTSKGRKTYIAKDKKEAMEYMEKLVK